MLIGFSETTKNSDSARAARLRTLLLPDISWLQIMLSAGFCLSYQRLLSTRS